MEEKDQQIIIAKIQELLGLLGVEGKVEPRFLEGANVFNIRTEDSGILIGQHGSTLGALQHMVRVLCYAELDGPAHIVIDVEDYKKNREEFLMELARQAVDRVRQTNQALLLKPMAAYERRIVHKVISGFAEVETESRGEEPERRVLIKPV